MFVTLKTKGYHFQMASGRRRDKTPRWPTLQDLCCVLLQKCTVAVCKFGKRQCMGTAESRPEPLIDHLRQALSQPHGHRWMQFHLSDWKGWSLAPRPHLRADSQERRLSIWKSLSLDSFCEPRTWVSSLFHYFFVNVIISLVLCLVTLQSVYLIAIHTVKYTPKGLRSQSLHSYREMVDAFPLWECLWESAFT